MSENDLVLALDLGTTLFKVALVDRSGVVRGLARVRVPRTAERPEYCELPVAMFWACLQRGVAEALAETGCDRQSIRAISYSSQASSFVLLDSNRHPLTQLILWPDLRASGQALPGLFSRPDFTAITGVGSVTPQSFLAKIEWIQKNRAELWRKAARIETISDHLVSELTGYHFGDAATASLLGIWNLAEQDWWREGLSESGISRSQLSKPLRPGSFIALLSEQGSKRLGVPEGVPFAVGSLDHHAASVGLGLQDRNEIALSLGTVVCCLCRVERPISKPNCCLGPDIRPASYYRIAFDTNGTARLDAYIERTLPDFKPADAVALAAAAPVDCDGLVAPPASRSSAELDGFQNVSPEHTPAFFVRALLVSTAFTVRNLVSDCADDLPSRILACGGGAESRLWLQIIADVTGIAVIPPCTPEPACLGAATFAAVAAGWFPSVEQAVRTWSCRSPALQPDADNHRYYGNHAENAEFRRKKTKIRMTRK